MFFPNALDMQVEAIHPVCAIISQHMKAQELCSQTKKEESKNQTEQQGIHITILFYPRFSLFYLYIMLLVHIGLGKMTVESQQQYISSNILGIVVSVCLKMCNYKYDQTHTFAQLF